MFVFFSIAVFVTGCESSAHETPSREMLPDSVSLAKVEAVDTATMNAPIADVTTIFNRKQIPVLCYHQIREWRAKDSKVARDYIVPVNTFREQVKMLKDSGYQTILPDQLTAYLEKGGKLPAKPVMLTFDDTDLSQYTEALPELNKAGFKAVFFIMTVSLNRPGYMSKDQVKQLAQEGHVIGSHTWDHHNVKKYTDVDWVTQIEKPTQQLQAITGMPVKYFAYPFGLWDSSKIPDIKKRGFTAAFQLSTKRDPLEPMYTIRRIIVPGSWSPSGLSRAMKTSF